MLMGVMGTNLAIWGLGTTQIPGLWWPGQHSWQAVPRTIPSCPITSAGPSCVRAGTRKWLSTTRRVLLGEAAGGWIGKFCRYTKVLQHSILYPSPSSTTFNEPHSYVYIYIKTSFLDFRKQSHLYSRGRNCFRSREWPNTIGSVEMRFRQQNWYEAWVGNDGNPIWEKRFCYSFSCKLQYLKHFFF
jgi:hypothetical protein